MLRMGDVLLLDVIMFIGSSHVVLTRLYACTLGPYIFICTVYEEDHRQHAV